MNKALIGKFQVWPVLFIKVNANLYVLNSVASYNTSTIYSMMKIILYLNLTGK